MQEAKIIIGANFGDEGKGLATHYFTNKAIRKNKSCIVVKHNGGSQAGHTIVKNGKRYIFGTFGSGTVDGVPTYLASTFMLNPMIFIKEYNGLPMFDKPEVYIDENILLTIPFDMILNQFVEELRGKEKHGSCGIGIFETFNRNNNPKFALKLSDILVKKEIDFDYAKNKILSIANEYIQTRLPVDKQDISDYYKDLFFDDVVKNNIVEHYLEDLNDVLSLSEICDRNILRNYDIVVFETGQGLLLDQNNKEYFPNLTPSNTGIKNFLDYVDIFGKENMKAYYITRTYITRHGAGKFYTECKKDKINANMYDKTNVPNKYQDTLRYGYLDIQEFNDRIYEDVKDSGIDYGVIVTHLNETSNKLATKNGLEDINKLNNVEYISFSENLDDFRKY